MYKNFVIDDPEFLVIREVCRKVAEFATPTDRHLWNERSLTAKDEEMALWMPVLEKRVFLACEEIIRRFGDAG